MEGSSRTRTILGIGLVLIGSLLLFRSFSAPIFPDIGSDPRAGHDVAQTIRIEERRAQIEVQIEAQREQVEAQREQVEAQIEAQHEQIEAQREQIDAQTESQAEARRAQIDAQREQIEAQAEAQREQIDAQREQIDAQAEAQREQIDAQREQFEAQAEARAMPTMPPMRPFWHIGRWLTPTTVLLGLLILILWRRGRGERTPAQA